MTDAEIVKYLIENSYHMTVATADEHGKPWVSPVFFVADEQRNIFWVSDKAARHSTNLKNRPQVAIVIYGPVPPEQNLDGVYIDAEAYELQDGEDIKHAVEVLAIRKQPDKFTINSVDDVTGEAAWRIYRAVPKEITKRSDAIDEKSGQAVTVRKPIQ